MTEKYRNKKTKVHSATYLNFCLFDIFWECLKPNSSDKLKADNDKLKADKGRLKTYKDKLKVNEDKPTMNDFNNWTC